METIQKLLERGRHDLTSKSFMFFFLPGVLMHDVLRRNGS